MLRHNAIPLRALRHAAPRYVDYHADIERDTAIRQPRHACSLRYATRLPRYASECFVGAHDCHRVVYACQAPMLPARGLRYEAIRALLRAFDATRREALLRVDITRADAAMPAC